jgi:DNA-binding response OmpR family regulator
VRTPTIRVLVVDDDEPVRRLIRLNLELEGFEVDVAGDGREALTKVKAAPPDVITLDLVMPALDGLSAAARLRGATHSRHIPLVLITGAATPRDRIRADEIGIDVVLAKPFAPADLVAAVRGVIGTTRAPNNSEKRARSGH